MKASKKIVSFLLTMILCLSMGMTVFANENLYSEDNADTYIVESENTQVILPRYTANIDFSEIPAGYATHGGNRFHMNQGGTITCRFSSTGKFSLALYNYDTGKFIISNTIHLSSCNSTLTVNAAGNYGIGVYNRDTKAIKVTGSYTL